MYASVVLVLSIGSVVVAPNRDKRILLHDDTDIVQAIQALQNKVTQLESVSQNEIATLKQENTQLQNTVAQLQCSVSHLGSSSKHTGSTYVRWGRTTCPVDGTSLVYSGYMGGGWWNDYGATSNYLCLSANPTWDHYDEHTHSGGKIYGTEYEFWEHTDEAASFFGTNLRNQDAPCAVCHSPRSTNMMIPGRNHCYPGWTKEYSRYLVSGAEDHKAATEYVCLDRRPEVIPGGGANRDGSVLYLVEGVCSKGSLECPPYVDGRELTCVVCTM